MFKHQVIIIKAFMAIALILMVLFTGWWTTSALKVDFNGLFATANISHAADLGKDIGAANDALMEERLQMQISDDSLLRLAARMTFLQRLAVTIGLLAIIFLGIISWAIIARVKICGEKPGNQNTDA